MNIIELMSPAGSFESLMAAIQGGANSVYFGIEHLNMRSRSSANFTIKDLSTITQICKENGIKTYLTLNTILYDNELSLMHTIVDEAVNNNITAIIASDISVLQYARLKNIDIHISTQCNITNIDAVRFYALFADVMVTARELSLTQVKDLTQTIQKENITGPSGNLVKIEAFAHGALCMAVSGKCYLSLDTYNYSANRGACLQLCRRSYSVTDKEEGTQLEIDNQYIMSPKDLCTIGFLDKMIDAGISVFKIEGRGRSPEYVKTVTRCYRTALNAIQTGTYDQELIDQLTEELKTVYNRGFWEGYYLGKKMGEWAERYGSVATQKKIFVGTITNYFNKIGVAEVKIETNDLAIGDKIVVLGPTTGVYEGTIKELRVNLSQTQSVKKGDVCSIPVQKLVRRQDKLYKIIPSDLETL
ncbi:MAG: peptidase U32 family protein [Bacteroidota bacterium]